MRVKSITISGFRCFGADPQLIDITGDLTAIIGPNASGKTAVLQALCKLFGVTRSERTIRRSDFHLPVGLPPDDRSKRMLTIDIILVMPELAKGSATAHTIAPAFKHMQIAGPGAEPACRMRLIEAATRHLEVSCKGVKDWSQGLDVYEGTQSIPLMTIHKSKGLEYLR